MVVDDIRQKRDTRQKIVEAAMLQFAEKGLQTASTRAITKIAGVNSALVGYYFGSKQALFREVVELCTERLNKPRLERLAQLEAASDGPIPLETLLDCLVEPYKDGFHNPQSDSAIYLRFYGRFFTDPSDWLGELLAEQFRELQARSLDAIDRTIPHVPRRVLALRFGFMISALVAMAAEVELAPTYLARDGKTIDVDALFAEFIHAHCAMLRAPAFNAAALSETLIFAIPR